MSPYRVMRYPSDPPAWDRQVPMIPTAQGLATPSVVPSRSGPTQCR